MPADRITYLGEFPSAGMKWQDVPLRLNKRARDFLIKFELGTLKRIDVALGSERVRCPKAGKQISVHHVPNFGICSLDMLKSELTKLSRLGLEKYRYGNSGKNKYADSEMKWSDIPLRLSKRNHDFLIRFELETLKDIASVLLSEKVPCPKTGVQISVFDVSNFGPRSFAELRSEITKLSRLRLENYRYGKSGKNKYANSNLKWRDVPLRLERRPRDFLDQFELVTLKSINATLVSKKVICPTTGRPVLISEIPNFSAVSFDQIRQEMAKLSKIGHVRYAYGVSEQPTTGKKIANAFLGRLSVRDRRIIKSRCNGQTLDRLASRFEMTRERVRQIVKEAVRASQNLRENAQECLAPANELLDKKLVLPFKTVQKLVKADSAAELRLIYLIAEQTRFENQKNQICRFSRLETESCRTLFTYLFENNKLRLVEGHFLLRQMIEDAGPSMIRQLDVCQAMVKENDIAFAPKQIQAWLGAKWMHTKIRRQLAGAGSRGIEWKKIETLGIAKGKNLEAIANMVGESIGKGFVRAVSRITKYPRFELEDVLRANPGSMSIAEISNACQRKRNNSSGLVRNLSESNEIALDAIGRYIHIENLGLTISDVENLGIWAFDLLKQKQGRIDPTDLLHHLQKSNLRFRKQILNQSQVISMAAKHPGIRRCGRKWSVEFSNS